MFRLGPVHLLSLSGEVLIGIFNWDCWAVSFSPENGEASCHVLPEQDLSLWISRSSPLAGSWEQRLLSVALGELVLGGTQVAPGIPECQEAPAVPMSPRADAAATCEGLLEAGLALPAPQQLWM